MIFRLVVVPRRLLLSQPSHNQQSNRDWLLFYDVTMAPSLSDDERPSKKSKTNQDDGEDDNVNNLSAAPLLGLDGVGDDNDGTHVKFQKQQQQPIIVLLDQASLETIKNKRGIYELLNCDDHRDLCKKKLHKDPNLFRPDILHQELLALLDSPLNKAGLLKVYIHTTKNVLIDVHPSIRIPRTYKRFAGLMVQLLHKLKIKAGNTSSTTLLKVIKNPFSSHLPPGTRCYGFSCEGMLYSPISLAKVMIPPTPSMGGGDDEDDGNATPPTCLVIGAMSTGHVTIDDHPYIEKMYSVSSYPLSGAAAASRILTGIEHYWGIV
jgi:rRNA small subunit pseudouridine methyltransferase Nep1